jgi:hypothetical protein
MTQEMTLERDDREFQVRFDYERGEASYFDHRAGVGSPGYDPCVWITEVNFGGGWREPDPTDNLDSWEEEIIDRLAAMESECDRDEAEYDAFDDRC